MIQTPKAIFPRMLAYYRAPLGYPQMADIASRLPAGLTEVLEILNESNRAGSRLQQVANEINVSVEELRQAVYFYIKRVLFADDAGYYRTLGTDSDASIDAIRHHYRLLIRLFHPDKCPGVEAWDDLYAARINQAYNTLKRTDKRKRYDSQKRSTHKPTAAGDRQPVHAAHKPRSRRPATADDSLLQRFQGSYIWQRFPKAVVVVGMGTGLLLVLLMAALSSSDPVLKMMDNPPVEMTDNSSLTHPPVDERREAFMRAIKGTAYSAASSVSEQNKPANAEADSESNVKAGGQ